MRLTHLTLHNFRCFSRLDLNFDQTLIVLEGPNGTGKSSIGEALYYACYLRSFRTHKAEDIALHETGYFFIELGGITEDGDAYTIHVGVEEGIKKIKVNHTLIHTYKELMDSYQVVMVSEHDMRLIQEGPDERRAWINQLCILKDPSVVDMLRLHKHIVAQRTQLLMTQQGATDHYVLWSGQLWENSVAIRAARQASLVLLEREVAELIAQYHVEMPPITFTYKARGGQGEQFDLFWAEYQKTTLYSEIAQRRTLFGAHLDDIIINWGGQNARLYASRGQQKLILLLIKCAMVRVLKRSERGLQPTLMFILDDFITDLDQEVATAIIRVIQSLGCNVLITCPLKNAVVIPGPHQRITLPIL